MFVAKTPKRSDFCGCPPCPLCFDFVEPAPPRVVEVEAVEELPYIEPVVIDGLEKMARDLLGREPNAEERKIMKEAGERVHVNNLNAKIERDKLIAERSEQAQTEHFNKKLMAKIKGIQAERNQPKPLNHINIDDMDPKKVEELCGTTAPVDNVLVNREREALKAAKGQYEAAIKKR
jgi:hypothetical protein